MITLIKYLFVGMLAFMFGCQSVSQNRLQYLKGADPSKASVSIVDQEYFDVQNLSIKPHQADDKLIIEALNAKQEGLLTEQEFKNLTEAYGRVAFSHCLRSNKFLSYGVYVAENTVRFKCLSVDEKVEQELKANTDLCTLIKKTHPKETNITFPNECIGSKQNALPPELLVPYNSFCKKFTAIVSSNSKPTCDFLEKRYHEYQLVNKEPTLNKIEVNLNAAKEKCGQLGFTDGTEAFGKCVLQLSRQ